MDGFIYGVAISLIAISGCSGRQCLKVGGSYDGISGNIEYCFDQDASTKEGVPAFSDIGGNKLYIITSGQLDDIKNKINSENKEEKVIPRAYVPLKSLFSK